MTSDNRVPRNLLFLHAKVGAGVLHEHVVLDKGAGVAEQVNPLSCGQLALLVLSLDPLDSSTKQSFVSLFFNFLFHSQCLLGTCKKK